MRYYVTFGAMTLKGECLNLLLCKLRRKIQEWRPLLKILETNMN